MGAELHNGVVAVHEDYGTFNSLLGYEANAFRKNKIIACFSPTSFAVVGFLDLISESYRVKCPWKGMVGKIGDRTDSSNCTK